jgi:hypothetical protein
MSRFRNWVFRRNLKRAERECATRNKALATSLDAVMQENYSDPLFEFRRDYDQTVARLSDRNAMVRGAAIYFLANDWHVDARAIEVCNAIRRIAHADEAEAVRALAVSFLGSIFASSQDSRTSRELATIVLAQNESVAVRISAYKSLCFIVGLPMRLWPRETGFEFPEHVNWDLVHHAARSEGSASDRQGTF